MYLILRGLLLILITSSLSCFNNEESDSGKISFTALPDTPIVINAPKKVNGLNGDEISLEKPWFKFKFQLTNNSDLDLVIVAMKLRVAGSDTEYVVDSSYVSASADALITVDKRNQTTKEPTTATFAGFIYFGGLPDQGGSFSYTIEVEPLGWFGSDIEQEGRFNGIYTFSTQ